MSKIESLIQEEPAQSEEKPKNKFNQELFNRILEGVQRGDYKDRYKFNSKNFKHYEQLGADFKHNSIQYTLLLCCFAPLIYTLLALEINSIPMTGCSAVNDTEVGPNLLNTTDNFALYECVMFNNNSIYLDIPSTDFSTDNPYADIFDLLYNLALGLLILPLVLLSKQKYRVKLLGCGVKVTPHYSQGDLYKMMGVIGYYVAVIVYRFEFMQESVYNYQQRVEYQNQNITVNYQIAIEGSNENYFFLCLSPIFPAFAALYGIVKNSIVKFLYQDEDLYKSWGKEQPTLNYQINAEYLNSHVKPLFDRLEKTKQLSNTVKIMTILAFLDHESKLEDITIPKNEEEL